MTTPKPWPQELTRIVGRRVKHLRENRRGGRWSAPRLTEETERLGHLVKTSVINNMESGRRSDVTLAEIMVLARALEATPLELVVPLTAEDDFPVSPHDTVHPWDAFRWLSSDVDEFRAVDKASSEYAQAVDAYRRHEFAVDRWLRAYLPNHDLSASSPYLDSIVNVRAELRSRGWRLPDLSAWAGPSSEFAPELPDLIAEQEKLRTHRVSLPDEPSSSGLRP